MLQVVKKIKKIVIIKKDCNNCQRLQKKFVLVIGWI